MTQARLELDNYTTRVLDVIKGKFALKNRSEALNKLAEEHGSKYVEKELNEDVLLELDSIYKEHKKKHSQRKMSRQELKQVLNI